MVASYTVPHALMDEIYETLKFYANRCSYQGERTGGVLAGCPRGPEPTTEQLIVHAQNTLLKIDREVLGRAAQETEVAGVTAITTNSKYQRLQRCPHGVHQDNRCRVCD